jgi:transposase
MSGMARTKTPEIDDALWRHIKPLLPVIKPSARGGRPRLDDRAVLNGILFVLRSCIPWEDLPQSLGYGSGMSCWRRLRQWQELGVWHRLHKVLLKRLRDAGKLDMSRVCVDGASVASPRGANTQAPIRQIGASWAANGMS